MWAWKKKGIFANMKQLVTGIMLFSLLGLFSCKGQNVNHISVDGFAAALTPETPVLDVRTAEEFEEGHIRGAENIDWFQPAFVDSVKAAFGKDRPLYVYCRSGRRSAAAAEKLAKEGYTVYNMQGGYLAWTEQGREVTRYEVERFTTPKGTPVEIVLIKHASLEIRFGGLSIQVDPVAELGKKTNYATEFPKADYILVTHEHFDHFDQAAIGALKKEETILVTNARCADMAGWGRALSNGDKARFAFDLEAVPAYNTTEGHLQFHPQGRDNGYVLTLDGLRIYIAGDTEDIPQMADLKDIDIAFLPCNQPYTMTIEQCVHAAQMIRPKVLIPYHFGDTDLSGLPAQLPGMDVRLRSLR